MQLGDLFAIAAFANRLLFASKTQNTRINPLPNTMELFSASHIELSKHHPQKGQKMQLLRSVCLRLEDAFLPVSVLFAFYGSSKVLSLFSSGSVFDTARK